MFQTGRKSNYIFKSERNFAVYSAFDITIILRYIFVRRRFCARTTRAGVLERFGSKVLFNCRTCKHKFRVVLDCFNVITRYSEEVKLPPTFLLLLFGEVLYIRDLLEWSYVGRTENELIT